jgi:hypothetical protein
MGLIISLVFFYSGTITVSVLAAPESYDTIKKGFGDAIREINEIIRDGNVEIKPGNKIAVEIFLGGDYKVRRIIIMVYQINLICKMG